MPYFTTEAVATAAAQALSENGRSVSFSNASNLLLLESIDESLGPVPEEPAKTPPVLFDIFLSHSSLDQLQVLGIYTLLRRRNYSVYLDQVCDPKLNRMQVTRATARVLRYRMAQCKSLFVATSQNTTQSKWVPWELGFVDGWNAKTAVLPILPTGTVSFAGHEYFELYPEARDAGGARIYPNDIEIYDRRRFVASWGTWLGLPRNF